MQFRDEVDRKKFESLDAREKREKRIRALCIKLRLKHDKVKSSDITSRQIEESDLMKELKELLEERDKDTRFKPGIINNSW